jgi:hypothetical protein
MEAIVEKFRTNASAALNGRSVHRLADQILDSRSRGDLPALLDLVLT